MSVREKDKATEPMKVSRNSYDDQWDAIRERRNGETKPQSESCLLYRIVLVPKRYKPDIKLGTWVDTQRVQYKKILKHSYGALERILLLMILSLDGDAGSFDCGSYGTIRE